MRKKKEIEFHVKLHPKQEVIFKHPARIKVVVAGRRFGKTLLATYMSILEMFNQRKVWWISPVYSQGKVAWREVERVVGELKKHFDGFKVNRNEREVVYKNGLLAFKTADNPDLLRGESLDFVIVDEAAFMKEELYFDVILPSVMDRQGKIILISTPAGKNWFYRLYMEGMEDGEYIKSFHFTTYDNPFIPRHEIDRLKEVMSEVSFRREILAEFVEDTDMVFRNVHDLANAEVQYEAKEGHSYVIGVDIGRHHDFTVISVFDRTDGEFVYMDRFTGVSFDGIAERIKEVADRFNPDIIAIEANSFGEPVIETLEKEGLPVVRHYTTAKSKGEMIERLAFAFEKKEVRFIYRPEIVKEFSVFERVIKPNGTITYSAPSGFHDDIVMSFAISYAYGNSQNTASVLVFDEFET